MGSKPAIMLYDGQKIIKKMMMSEALNIILADYLQQQKICIDDFHTFLSDNPQLAITVFFFCKNNLAYNLHKTYAKPYS